MSIINAIPLLAAAGGDYQISRSVRLRSSASAYFNRTPGTASNQKTFTFSGWIKRGALSGDNTFFCARQLSTSTPYFYLSFDNSTNILSLNANTCTLYTTAVYRDPSAWYHVVYAVDTTQATSSDRIKLYVNGVQVTTFGTASYPSLNADTGVNSAILHQIGAVTNGAGSRSQYFDGYLTEINFIDGQALTPSSFGETDTITGVWKPKRYIGTYGTNGFYLNFSDNSAATAAAIGKDNSGNANNWTPNNISVTAGVTYDSMIDVPTLYADRGNYWTLNPLFAASYSAAVLSNANLTAALTATSQINAIASSPLPTSGKWYWETTVVASNNGVSIGVNSAPAQQTIAGATTGYGYYNATGNKYLATVSSAYGTAWYGVSRTDVIGTAYDADTGQLSFYLNGVSQGVAATLTTGVSYYPEGSHESGTGSHTQHWNFGQRPFAYTPPTGFKALNTQNLPAPTILKGNQYFDATTWTGNGGTQSIANSGSMRPDLVWLKSRGATFTSNNNNIFDSVRGANKAIFSDLTNAEVTYTDRLNSFDTGGFTVAAGYNTNSGAFVGWQWKANGSAVSNTSGTITSQVSAGTSQGFSVVTYTGNGVNATVGHGLGVAPKMVIIKSRTVASGWTTYFHTLGAGNFLSLDSTAVSTASIYPFNNTAPTSSVFSIGVTGNGTNNTGATYVAYCFSEVDGFSKFGSYAGNNSTDGPFLFCGFRPRFIMLKSTSAVTGSWVMIDTARDSYNASGLRVDSNANSAETDTRPSIDVLSNGFKIRKTADDNWNNASANYIFAAFAEHPFKNSLAR
jgi:hypothetical protein